MNLTTSRLTPSTGRVRPVPNSASITTWGDSLNRFRRACQSKVDSHSANSICPRPGPWPANLCAALKFVRASPFVSSILPNSTNDARAPASESSLAVAAPSPPLFPGPHSTSTDFPATSPDRRSVTTPATAVAAASISISDGVPWRSVISRSISRIWADEITGCTWR